MDYYSPVTKQGISTFDHIIETAKKLFAEKGYNSTSINKIIQEAGIATGTFYIYFKDKLSLYEYILNDYKFKIRKHLNNAIKGYTTRYDIEYHGIKAFITFASQDILSYNIIWESLFVDRNLFIDYYSNFAKSYMHVLEHSKELNEIRDIDLETLSYILMGIANFVGLQAIFKTVEQGKPLDEEKIDKLVKIVMDVLSKGMFK